MDVPHTLEDLNPKSIAKRSTNAFTKTTQEASLICNKPILKKNWSFGNQVMEGDAKWVLGMLCTSDATVSGVFTWKQGPKELYRQIGASFRALTFTKKQEQRLLTRGLLMRQGGCSGPCNPPGRPSLQCVC